jgi:hypothetical protein
MGASNQSRVCRGGSWYPLFFAVPPFLFFFLLFFLACFSGVFFVCFFHNFSYFQFSSEWMSLGVISIEQISKASQKAQKCTFCHTETAWHCGADRAFEGQLVVAPSAPWTACQWRHLLALTRLETRFEGQPHAPRRCPRHTETAWHYETGQLRRGPFARFETPING